MKLLITGAEGQLGRCLQDKLADTTYQVYAISRKDLDITDRRAVLEHCGLQQPDMIINAAAYTAVDKAETDQEDAWAVNATAVENLAYAANQVGAGLIHISTDYVFDGNSSRPYLESDPVNPGCVYGASKLAGEQAAMQADRHLIVRTAWVFSEYGHNFLKTMLRLALERDCLSVVDDQFGAPTYAGDLAAALIKLCEAFPENGIYHFSGGDTSSWFEFAAAIFEICEQLQGDFISPQLLAIPSSKFPTPAKRPKYSVLDGHKLLRQASIPAGDWRGSLRLVCAKELGL